MGAVGREWGGAGVIKEETAAERTKRRRPGGRFGPRVQEVRQAARGSERTAGLRREDGSEDESKPEVDMIIHSLCCFCTLNPPSCARGCLSVCLSVCVRVFVCVLRRTICMVSNRAPLCIRSLVFSFGFFCKEMFAGLFFFFFKTLFRQNFTFKLAVQPQWLANAVQAENADLSLPICIFGRIKCCSSTVCQAKNFFHFTRLPHCFFFF